MDWPERAVPAALKVTGIRRLEASERIFDTSSSSFARITILGVRRYSPASVPQAIVLSSSVRTRSEGMKENKVFFISGTNLQKIFDRNHCFADTAIFQEKFPGRCIIRDTGLFHNHAGAAVYQLFVGKLHIYHMTAFHPSQTNHY